MMTTTIITKVAAVEIKDNSLHHTMQGVLFIRA